MLAEKFWPGPLTIIVKAASRLPLKVTANTGNIAIRIPQAEIPLQLIRAAQELPVTATSANLHGHQECTTAQGVREQLQEKVPLIVDGGTSPRSTYTTIINLAEKGVKYKIMRVGAVPVQEIEDLLGDQ